MLDVIHENDTVTVVLNRPEAKNAINYEMVGRFREALRGECRDARALILRSAVAGYFSIGMDLQQLRSGIAEGASTGQVKDAVGEYAALLKDLLAISCPVLAVVDGMAVGGGVDLIGTCDVVLASESSVFSIAQLRKGIFPLTTSGVLIPKIGKSAFLYWMLSGQNYSAEKARKLGLISVVVKSGEVDQRLQQFVGRVLEYDAEALALGMQAIRYSHPQADGDRLDYLAAVLALNCQLEKPHE